MAQVDRTLLDAERERSRRLRAAVTSDPPAIGEVWTVRSAVTSPRSGLVVEHSAAPLLVAVLRRSDEWLDVAPLSYDIDYAATGTVIERDDSLFRKPYMIETWLHLLAAATALERDMPLVTRNVADFQHIVGLRLINPFDQP